MRLCHAHPMGCPITFLLVRRLLHLLRLGPASGEKDVEIAVLRHQLAVLRRHAARPRYSPTDRDLLATLASLLPRERWSSFLVTPSTLLRWHRQLVARHWTFARNGTVFTTLSMMTSSPSSSVSRRRTLAGAIYASPASAQSSASPSRPRVCATSCAVTVFDRHRVLLDHRGRSSFERRLPARSPVTSSMSTRSHCVGSMCCSSSTSNAARCSWPA